MEDYSNQFLIRMMSQVLQDTVIDIKAIGNHHLKRHLVFCIKTSTLKKYVLKIYYKKDRRVNEINALKLLENSDLLVSKVVDYGEFYPGDEWLLLEYMDGIPLESTLNKLNQTEKEACFLQMGAYLGKMHSLRTFDGFSSWDKPIDINTYNELISRNRQEIYQEIEQLGLPEHELLIKAIKQVKANEYLLYINHQPRLTHNDFDGRNVLVNNNSISGIIDFEICIPGNFENDLIGLYLKYFYDNQLLEKAFLSGYLRFMNLDDSFYKRLPTYLLNDIIMNCSWAYYQAPDYYNENIKFLKKILS